MSSIKLNTSYTSSFCSSYYSFSSGRPLRKHEAPDTPPVYKVHLDRHAQHPLHPVWLLVLCLIMELTISSCTPPTAARRKHNSVVSFTTTVLYHPTPHKSSLFLPKKSNTHHQLSRPATHHTFFLDPHTFCTMSLDSQTERDSHGTKLRGAKK